MKILIVLFAFFLPTVTVTPNLAPVTKAISDGDAAGLSVYFDDSIDLTIIDKQSVVDKSQATAILREFFSKNTAKSFNTVHQGTSKGANSHYTIGGLSTSSGNFRVFLLYKSIGEKPIIQEIRIEK